VKPRVAFLFLGETLLIPHLFPIVEALARDTDIPIDLWVSTSVHERLLRSWIAGERVRFRRALGFRQIPDAAANENPRLPFKPAMLAGLIPHLLRTSVAVCAEQTSLWLPTLLPLRTKFVKTAHGAGSMSARADRRRKSATLTLTPSESEKQGLVDHGVDPSRIVVTGYVKASFRHRTPAQALFSDARPILLYTPHWQRHRSSWFSWGRAVIEQLIAQDRFNIIFAPHQRLIEGAPELRVVVAALIGLPHVHCDLDSFSMVDGTYTAAADLYVGDTSSQVVEFLARPRPCVFLNPLSRDWRDDPSYAQWGCGPVVDDVRQLMPAIDQAFASHRDFIDRQRAFAMHQLGDVSDRPPARIAQLIAELAGAA
jgi:hypothetical protein